MSARWSRWRGSDHVRCGDFSRSMEEPEEEADAAERGVKRGERGDLGCAGGEAGESVETVDWRSGRRSADSPRRLFELVSDGPVPAPAALFSGSGSAVGSFVPDSRRLPPGRWMRPFVVCRVGRSGSIADTVSSASCLCFPEADRTSVPDAPDALLMEAGSSAAGSVDGPFLSRTLPPSIRSASTWRGDADPDWGMRLLSVRSDRAGRGEGSFCSPERVRREMELPDRLPSLCRRPLSESRRD